MAALGRLVIRHQYSRTDGRGRPSYTGQLLQERIDLYHARPDKERSLTDCISFVVMQRERITEALTRDKHFEQSGFVALLK